MFSHLKLKTGIKLSRHWVTGLIEAAAEKHFWQFLTCESAGWAIVVCRGQEQLLQHFNSFSSALISVGNAAQILPLADFCTCMTNPPCFFFKKKEYINILQVQWMSESKSIPCKCTGVAVVLTEPLQLCLRCDESTGRILAMTSCPWLAPRRSQQMVHHQSSIQETNLSQVRDFHAALSRPYHSF